MKYKKQIIPINFGKVTNNVILQLEALVYKNFGIHKACLSWANYHLFDIEDYYNVTEINTGYCFNISFKRLKDAKTFVNHLIETLQNDLDKFFEHVDEESFKVKEEFELNLLNLVLQYKNEIQPNLFQELQTI